jgi:hypothetical protein
MKTVLLLCCVLCSVPALVLAQSVPTLPNGVTTCTGQFALCAASTCTPVLNRDGTAKMMRVRTEGGGVAEFPEMSCMCPLLTGTAIADLNGGNMRGSCAAPSKAGVWSLFKFEQNLPQQMNGWATAPPAQTATTVLSCAGTPGKASPVTNCFSMACTKAAPVNGVPLADCRCPLSETFAGAPWPLGAGYLTQAGQGNPSACGQFPIGAPAPSPTTR